MPAALTKISVGISCNFCLNFRDRLDKNICLGDEIIKPPSGYGIAVCIDDNSGFNEIDSADAPVCRVCNRAGVGHRLWFIIEHFAVIDGAKRLLEVCRAVSSNQ